MLKSTLDYWVTIKDELKVHVETAEMLPAATYQELEEDHHCNDAANMDDFHRQADDDDQLHTANISASESKLPILKIKIKRDHDTLNYTLVDEAKEREKKKKSKDAEKQKEKVVSIIKKKLHHNFQTI